MNTGKIIKSKSTERFTTLPNDLIKSIELSLDEKGLLSYLLSLPSDWIIYKKNLYNSLPDKHGTIDKAFKGLQTKGYIHSYKVNGEDGKFVGWNHIVYDEKQNQPTLQKPKVGFTEVGESAPILNTNIILKTNKDKVFTPPTINEVVDFFLERGDTEQNAKTAFDYYSLANWKDSRGKAVKNWKQKMLAVWINKNNFNNKTTKQSDYELRKNHYTSVMQWAATIDRTEKF
jgi:hypothetical protein